MNARHGHLWTFAISVCGVLIAVFYSFGHSSEPPAPPPDAIERLKSRGVRFVKGDLTATGGGITYMLRIPKEPLPPDTLAELSSIPNLTGLAAEYQTFSNHLAAEIAGLTALEEICFNEVEITPEEMSTLNRFQQLHSLSLTWMTLNQDTA